LDDSLADIVPEENAMKFEGGCYCGKVRYEAEGEPMLKAQCHCRECKYISGGATRPQRPVVVVKVGTLDDPELFGGPKMAIYTIDRRPFHQIPEGLQTFERLPQR
jgi:hypothetical protein